MTEEYIALRDRALNVRLQYLAGEITYPEAKVLLKEYIAAFNAKSVAIAEKYQQKPKKLNVSDFLKFAP